MLYCYHVELVVDIGESVFHDEILHLHSAVRWGVSGHDIGDVGHALHATSHHHILEIRQHRQTSQPTTL